MRRISLLALPTLLVLGFCLSTASGATPTPPATSEVAEEANEASLEASEDASAMPQDMLMAQSNPRKLAKIERLKERINNLRAQKRVVRQLPHSTTRYKVHLPKKRARIKALRAHIRALRAS